MPLTPGRFPRAMPRRGQRRRAPRGHQMDVPAPRAAVLSVLDGTQFQLKWMWQMLRKLRYSPHIWRTKGRMVRLAEYSRDCLKALRESTGIQYEGRQGGTLQLFRTEKRVSRTLPATSPCWKMQSVPYQLLEAKRLLEVEPALAEIQP